MSVGIRKPGQGYWVRVLSAVFWGAIVLAAAAWAYNEAAAFPLPARSYTMSALTTTGTAAVGDSVTLRRTGPDGKPEVIGSAALAEVDTAAGGQGVLTIDGFGSKEVRSKAIDTEEILIGDPATPSFRALIESRRTASTPIFEPTYLRAGAAGLVLLSGFIGLLYFVGFGRKTTDFLIATDGEMKKVNWSTKKEIRGTTIVVIVASFLIAGFLFLVDIVFKMFFTAIDVLQT